MKDEGLESPAKFLDPAKRMGILGGEDFFLLHRNALMKLASPLLFTLAFLTLPGSAQDQTVPVPELETLKKEYASLVQTVNGPHLAAVAELDKKYIAKLEQAQQTAQQAGKLVEALAIDEDKKSFSSGKGVPVEDDAKTPPMLKQMHATYRAEIAKLEPLRAKNLKPLRDDYASELDALVLRLTKAGKLKEAMTVSKFRQSLPASPASAPPVAGLVAETTRGIEAMIARSVKSAAVAKESVKSTEVPRLIDKHLLLEGVCLAGKGIVVPRTATLELAAGTVLIMGDGTAIEVDGKLLVRGSANNMVTLCGRTGIAASWQGLVMKRSMNVKYSPSLIKGLLVMDAERGLDFWIEGNAEPKFGLVDSVFFNNKVGIRLGRFGQGIAEQGTIENCLFAKNTEAGALVYKILEPEVRFANCTFYGNGIGMTATETAYDLGSAQVARRCLFVKNKIAVIGVSTEGSIAESVFDGNEVHVQSEQGRINISGNYWGADTTSRLNDSKGLKSDGKISPRVAVKKWVLEPPKKVVGAQLPK
jgi:hypothetical protein